MSDRKSKRVTTEIGQYRDRIVRYPSKFVPLDCVEGFAQERLLKAHAYRNNGQEIGTPLAFLYTTANNVVRKSYRDENLNAAIEATGRVDASRLAAEAPSAERT